MDFLYVLISYTHFLIHLETSGGTAKTQQPTNEHPCPDTLLLNGVWIRPAMHLTAFHA